MTCRNHSWLIPSLCSYATYSELHIFSLSRINFQTFIHVIQINCINHDKKHCLHANVLRHGDVYFRKFYFCQYLFPCLFISVVDITFLGVCTHARGRRSSHSLKPCRSTPCWQEQESLCQTSWALTSREIYRFLWPAHLTGKLFQTSMQIYSGSCRGPRLLVLALRSQGQTSQQTLKADWGLGERAVGLLWRNPAVAATTLWLLVHCLYPTQCREALCKVAWIRKWFCPPTGTDLKSVCASELRAQGENEMRWYILTFLLLL